MVLPFNSSRSYTFIKALRSVTLVATKLLYKIKYFPQAIDVLYAHFIAF